MSIDRYNEALEIGLTRREAGLYAVALELAEIFKEMREREERFAASLYMTRAEICALPVERRDALNRQYLAWCAAESSRA